MKSAAALLAAIFFCGVAIAEDFTIDDYDFTWNVAESGENKLTIRKDHKGLNVWLSGGGLRSLYLRPGEAQKIGESLAKFPDYQKRLTNIGASETVKIGDDIQIEFENSDKLGFCAFVTQKTSRFSSSNLVLYSKDIKILAPHLVKAEAMAAFVDSKIKP